MGAAAAARKSDRGDVNNGEDRAMSAPGRSDQPVRGEPRTGLHSIGGQMITATVALLVVVLAVLLAIEWRALTSLGEEQAEARGATVNKATREMARSLARNTAVASSAALLESGYLYLQTLVDTTARSNSDVIYVLVVDESNRIVADSRVALGKAAQQPLDDDIARRVIEQKRSQVLTASDPSSVGLSVFAAPIIVDEAEEGRDAVIGHVRVGMSMEGQQREVVAARLAARAGVERAIRLAALVTVFLLIVGIFIAVLQGLKMSRPIMRLASQAERIANGDLDHRVTPQGASEIRHLSVNFNNMADRITELLEETARKAAIDKELEIAHAVQTSLVPPSELINAAGLDLVGFFEPATHCGGDWWLWKKLDDSRVLIVIADVTGHGLPAALITAAAIGCTETIGGDIRADDVLRLLNGAVSNAGKGDFWMSCFVSIFDHEQRTVEYANGGHPMPYVARRKGDQWLLDSLVARGPLLGERALGKVRVRTTELGPDDIVLWYTDGINECFGPDGGQWGEAALRRAFEASLVELSDVGEIDPTVVRDHIVAAVKAFAGATPRQDDLTLVVGTGLGRALELPGLSVSEDPDDQLGESSSRRAG